MEENTENDNLFNIDFNSISDDTIEMSDLLTEEKSEVVEVTLEDEDGVEHEINSPDESEGKEKKKKTTAIAEDSIDIDEEDNKDENPGSEAESSSPVTPFATLLHERGFLPNFDSEAFNEAVVESEDPFGVLAQAMKNELDYANASFINSFPPNLIDMAKSVAAGVPFDALKGPKLQEINYSKISEEQLTGEGAEGLQRKLVGDYYASKGFSDKKINRLVDTLGDAGNLEEEAIEAKFELEALTKKRQEQIKKQFQDQQVQMNEQQTAQIEYIGKSIDGVDEIIPGLKMTKNVKDRLFHNMTQIVGQDNNGQPLNYTMSMRQNNPVAFDLAVTYLADITKGFSDWGKLTNTAKTSATKELEKTLQKTSNHVYGTPKKEPRSEKSEEALISSLSSMFSKK